MKLTFLLRGVLATLFFAGTFLSLNGQSGDMIKPVAARVLEAQRSGVRFAPYAMFEQERNAPQDYSATLKEATFLRLDKSSLTGLLRSNAQSIELSFPYKGRTLTLDLVQREVLTDNFYVTTSVSGDKPVSVSTGKFYRGIIKDNPNSVASVSFFNNEVMGIVSIPGEGNIVLGKMDNAGDETYVCYSDQDMKVPFELKCGVDDEFVPAEEIQQLLENSPERATKCVKVYIECDYKLFQNKGSVNNVVDFISGVFANLATLYDNESISTEISQIYVWTTPDSYSTTSSSTALNQFKAARPTFNGDLGHLAALGGQNIGGVAWLSGLCNTFKYAYSNIYASYSNFPTYSWTVEVMTHEMGHNLSSNHTHWCGWSGGAIDNCYTPEGSCARGPAPTNGGTIMSYCHLTSYGINFNNGFGPLPGNAIRNYVNTRSCLTECSSGGPVCEQVTGITVTNITSSSARLDWQAASGATTYNVQYKVASSSVWTTITTVNLFVVLNNLLPNTLYNYRIETVCGNGTSGFTPNGSFKTLNNCGTPDLLDAFVQSPTSATVEWTPVAGATGYMLQYRLRGATTWINITVNANTTTVLLNNLLPNSTYEYRLQTFCANSTPGITEIKDFSTGGCATPTNLRVTNITPTSAIATWKPVATAKSYKLQYRRTADTVWTTVSTVDTTYTMTGLQPSTEYAVRVQSICGQDTSGYSQPVIFTTGNPSGCATPDSLKATNVTSSTALLSWTAVSGALSYNVQYKKASDTTWTTLSATTNSITLTGLMPLTTYDARVQAVCASGPSNYSATIQFTTLSTTCGTPTQLSVTGITSSSATLNWSNVPGAVTYTVQYRPETTSNWTTVSNVTTNSYTLNGLTAGMTYYFRVRTNCADTTSEWSEISTFATNGSQACSTPTGLSATNITTTSALVKWNAALGALSYKLQYRVAGTVIWTSVTTNATSYTLTGLTPNTTYEYRVQTVCIFGTSSFSGTNTFTTLPDGNAQCGKATGLSATNITANSALVSWKKASNAVSYTLRYKATTDPTWTSVSVSDTSYLLTGLTPATTYQYTIGTVCNGAVNNSDTATFKTLDVCLTPGNLRVLSVTSNTAKLAWSGNSAALSYMVRYRASGDTAWTMVTTTDTTLTVNGLSPDTKYEWQVKATCKVGDSGFSGSSTFRTNALCLAPTGLAITNITTSSATASWNAVNGVAQYILYYRVSNTNNWTVVAVNGTQYALSGLQAGTNYAVRVRSICAESDTSDFSAEVTFTTTSNTGCPAPTGLTATNITSTSALIRWNKVNNVLLYNVQYRQVGATNWTGPVNAGSNSLQINNLSPSTTYEVRVQSVCLGKGSSAYSDPIQFTTLPTSLPAAGTLRVELVPNPARDILNVFIRELAENSAAKVELYDPNGRIVRWLQLPAGQQNTTLDVSQLPSGIYFIRTIVDDHAVFTSKLVKE